VAAGRKQADTKTCTEKYAAFIKFNWRSVLFRHFLLFPFLFFVAAVRELPGYLFSDDSLGIEKYYNMADRSSRLSCGSPCCVARSLGLMNH